jgi:thiamine biosynthesis lipoprotein
MRIGLGGIAKGYAVERAAAVIHRHGFRDFAIKAGGDMRVMGLWNDKPWKIGIRDPRDREGTIAILPVSNVAISTAGDYERFFDLGGKRYAHILDPKTGYPVQHTWSVTIVARDCTLSDGLDDGIFVLGAEKGMALVESLPNVEAVIIDAQGQLHMSRGLAKR